VAANNTFEINVCEAMTTLLATNTILPLNARFQKANR
jgi:hypothetical protein